MADTIKIHGLQELLAQLGDLDSLVSQKRILSKALREGGKIIADEAEHLAPIGSGRLAASMMVSISEPTADSAIAKIGPSRFYGRFQEHGTAHHGKQSFLLPAFDAKNDEALSTIGFFLMQGITKEIKKQVKKAGKR